jgi:large subunit ribosomal protein L21e
MVTRKGGNRHGTRQTMRKTQGTHGKFSLRRYLQILNAGDKVSLVAESSVHKGLYFKRFHGKVANVVSKKGFCYEVELKDGNKLKTLIVHPVHLVKIKE